MEALPKGIPPKSQFWDGVSFVFNASVNLDRIGTKTTEVPERVFVEAHAAINKKITRRCSGFSATGASRGVELPGLLQNLLDAGIIFAQLGLRTLSRVVARELSHGPLRTELLGE